jgi:hypothetical protein
MAKAKENKHGSRERCRGSFCVKLFFFSETIALGTSLAGIIPCRAWTGTLQYQPQRLKVYAVQTVGDSFLLVKKF